MASDDDRRFMRLALDEARAAGARGEIPVGAVAVHDGRVIAATGNASIERCDPTAHAEIRALREAGARLQNYRLEGVTLYATVEPCLMCLGALLHARVARLVFGADDPKLGGTRRLSDLARDGAAFNHRLEVDGDVLGSEASSLLLDFFRDRRGEPAPGRDPSNGEVPKWP